MASSVDSNEKTRSAVNTFYSGRLVLKQQNCNDSNTDGSFKVAILTRFESLGNSSDSSREQIYRDILGGIFFYYIKKMYFVCTRHFIVDRKEIPSLDLPPDQAL